MEEKATTIAVTEDPAGEYHLIHNQVRELVVALVGKTFGGQGSADSRPPFLVDLEMGRIDARVELNALTRVLMELLGIEAPKLFAYINDELGRELARLEEEVDSTGAPGDN